MITAEFVDASASGASLGYAPDADAISTNEGNGLGRMVMFVVDQNTLDLGSARQVATVGHAVLFRADSADRSALTLLPVGQGVGFTWAHGTVRDALQRVVGMAGNRTTWEYGSLADARDIANSNSMALRNLSLRECGWWFDALGRECGGGGGGGGGGGREQSPAAGPTPAPDPGGGSTGGAPGATGTPATGSGGRTAAADPAVPARVRRPSAASVRTAVRATCRCRPKPRGGRSSTSLTSVTAMRQTLAQLAKVRGDKIVILISGGWPLDERDESR